MSQSHGFTDDRDRQSTLSVGDESNRTADRESKTLEGSEAFADDRDHTRGETSTAEQAALIEASDRDDDQETLGDAPEDGAFLFAGRYEADPSDPEVWVCPKCDSARHRDKWETRGTSRTGFGLCPECWKPTPTSSLEADDGRRESDETNGDSFDFDDYGPTGRHPLPTAEATRDPDREALKARGVDVDGWDELEYGGTGGFHLDDYDPDQHRDAERHAEVLASVETNDSDTGETMSNSNTDTDPSTDTDLTDPTDLFNPNALVTFSVSFDDVPTPDGIPSSDAERKIGLAGRLLRAGGNRTGFGHHEEIRRSMEGWAPGRDEDDPDDHRRAVFSMGPGERNFGDLSGEPEEQLAKAETVIEWARSEFPDGVFGEIVTEQIDAAREKWQKAHEEERKRQRARQFEEHPPAEVNGWERFESDKPDVEVAYRAINHGTPAVVAVYRDESGELDAHESTLSEWNDAETAAESKVNRHMVTVTRDEVDPYRDVLSHLHTFDGEPIEEADDEDDGKTYMGLGAGRRRALDAIEETPHLDPVESFDSVDEMAEAIEDIHIRGYSSPPEDTIDKLRHHFGRLPDDQAERYYLNDYKLTRTINAARRAFNEWLGRKKRYDQMPGSMEAGPSNYPVKKHKKRRDSERSGRETLDEKLDRLNGRTKGAFRRALKKAGYSEAELNEQKRESKREQRREEWNPGDIVVYRSPNLHAGAIVRLNKKSVRVQRRNTLQEADFGPDGEFRRETIDLDSDHITKYDPDDIHKIEDDALDRGQTVPETLEEAQRQMLGDEWVEEHGETDDEEEPGLVTDGGQALEDEISERIQSSEVCGGFDLTHFGTVERFEAIVNALGLEYRGRRDGGAHVWTTGRVVLTTGNHPITGEFRQSENREPEPGYASYITVAGDDAPALELWTSIRETATSIKGETPLTDSDGRRPVDEDQVRLVSFEEEEPELATDGGTDATELLAETIGQARAKGISEADIQDALFEHANDVAAARWPDPEDGQEVATDGGQTAEPRAVDPEDPPANATVRLIKGITRVLHSPTIVEGATSSTGKTISVEEETSSYGDTRTYRLDSSEIFAGNTEFRKSTTFEIYTPERFRSSQRANHAPGSQTGSHGPTDADELPPATHRPPGEDVRDQARQERKEQAERQREQRRKEDPKVVYPYGWDEIDRGAEIILDGQRGTFMVLQVPQDVAGTYRGLKLLGPEGELYRLRSGNGDYRFLLEQGEHESAVTFMSRVDTAGLNEGGTVSVQDYEVIGEDSERLRRWIREEYHGE